MGVHLITPAYNLGKQKTLAVRVQRGHLVEYENDQMRNTVARRGIFTGCFQHVNDMF
jgi:hypothetical protein